MKNTSIKVNFIMNSILTMSSFVFPLITFPYVSRILLATGTGKVSFAASLITYFNMFAQLGIPIYGIRACAKVRDDKQELTKVAQELLIINLVMSLLAYIVLAFFLIQIKRLYDNRTLYILMSMTIFLSAIGMEWLYKALEQYTYITVRSIIFKFIALIAMFLLVNSENDYVIYGVITIFAASASNVLNFVNAHKYISLKPISNYNLKRHFKPILVFFAMSCATTVYTNLDTLMIGFIKKDVDVGYYNAAVKVKTILVSIVTALGSVLLPRSSYYVEKKMMDEFWGIAKKSILFVFLVAPPTVIYFIFFAKETILFLSGFDFVNSIVPMQIILVTVIFIGLSNILGMQILIPLGMEKAVLYSEIAGAVIDFTINLILIPKFASAGAAIGTVFAEVSVVIMQSYFLRHDLKILTNQPKEYLKIIIACIVSYISVLWVRNYISGNFLVLLVSAFMFFIIYVLVLLILREEFAKELLAQILVKVGKERK